MVRNCSAVASKLLVWVEKSPGGLRRVTYMVHSVRDLPLPGKILFPLPQHTHSQCVVVDQDTFPAHVMLFMGLQMLIA